MSGVMGAGMDGSEQPRSGAPDGRPEGGREVRWSARMGTGPEGERPPQLPTVPQRWMLTLVRRHAEAMAIRSSRRACGRPTESPVRTRS